MRVFISWSGPQSLAVARALHDWLPAALQTVKPWLSAQDINAGAKWTPEINRKLSEIKFGIICLTRENQHQPWVLFEAGALAKTLEDTHVVPYLIDMEESDIKGPLAQFQATRKLSKEGTFELVKSLNEAVKGSDGNPLAEKTLETVFERMWPDLQSAFKKVPEPESPTPPKRESDDILREILDLVRGLSRQANQPQTFTFQQAENTRRVLGNSSVLSPSRARRVERQQELEEEILQDLATEERDRQEELEREMLDDMSEEERYRYEDEVDPSAEMDAER